MQTDVSQVSVQPVAINVGLAAFQVAVVQQKQFEETLQRVSEKQSQIVDDLEHRAQEARKNAAQQRGGVDIVVGKDPSSTASTGNNAGNTANADPGGSGSPQPTDNLGNKVNLQV